MPIYHIYNGKDKVTSVLGDCINEFDRTNVIWQMREGVRDKKLAIIPPDYLIIIEDSPVKPEDSLNVDKSIEIQKGESWVEKLFPGTNHPATIRINQFIDDDSGATHFHAVINGYYNSIVYAETIEDIRTDLKRWYSRNEQR